MKKTFKRAGVAVLSMAMLLSMGAMTAITSNAADGTIQVAASTELKSSDTVTFYKVAQVSSSTGNWEWCNGANDTNVGTTMNTVNGYDESTNAAELKALASKLERLKAAGTISDSSPVTATVGGSAVSAAPGYYLGIVTSTDNSLTVAPILVAVKHDDASVVSGIKSSTVTLDKEIKSVTDGTVAADNESADVAGDADIVYTITADIPKYDTAVTTLDTHFTITDISTDVVVKSGTSPVVKIDTDGDGAFDDETALTVTTDYTYTANPTGGDVPANAIFSVVLQDTKVTTYGGEKVQVEFTANLKSGYHMMATANVNEAQLKYANDYATGTGSKTLDDKVNVYTAKLLLNKLITGDTSSSQSFNFTLKKKSGGSYTDYKTNISVTANGSAVAIDGLPTGQYQLVEDTVANFKPLSPIEFEIVDSNVNGTFTLGAGASSGVSLDADAYNVTATNTKVDALPGTGGMGTILFTVGGAAVVLLAGALFVVYMRRRKVEE